MTYTEPRGWCSFAQIIISLIKRYNLTALGSLERLWCVQTGPRRSHKRWDNVSSRPGLISRGMCLPKGPSGVVLHAELVQAPVSCLQTDLLSLRAADVWIRFWVWKWGPAAWVHKFISLIKFYWNASGFFFFFFCGAILSVSQRLIMKRCSNALMTWH